MLLKIHEDNKTSILFRDHTLLGSTLGYYKPTKRHIFNVAKVWIPPGLASSDRKRLLRKFLLRQTVVWNTPHAKSFSSVNQFTLWIYYAKMFDIQALKKCWKSCNLRKIRLLRKNCSQTRNLWAKGNVAWIILALWFEMDHNTLLHNCTTNTATYNNISYQTKPMVE